MLLGLFSTAAFAVEGEAVPEAYIIEPLSGNEMVVATGTFPGEDGAEWQLWSDRRIDVFGGTLNWNGGANGRQNPWYAHRLANRGFRITFHEPITAGPSLRGLFADISDSAGVTLIGLDQLDTSAVTDMSYMFYSTWADANIYSFDTQNVTNMRGMFQDALVHTIPLGQNLLSNLNTANVTDMRSMFERTRNSTINVSDFDTGNVTHMSRMFYGADRVSALDLSNFDTRNVTDMAQMFAGMTGLRQITLGEQLTLQGDVGLPAPTPTNTYTGRWRQVGTGTPENPIGRFVFTPWEFANLFTGGYMAGTYVWQRGERHHERFMQGSVNAAGQWSFRPTAQITRAEVAAILARTLIDEFDGSTRTTAAFSDVDGHWAHSYIAWAADHGTVVGDAGRFRPNNNVTRQEFATMVSRAIIGREHIPAGGTISSGDADRIPAWAANYIYAAYRNVWMRGDTNNNFNPQNNLTRGEAATVISRALGRGLTAPESIAPVRGDMMNFTDVTNPSSWFYYYVAQVANTHYFRIDNRKVWTRVVPPPMPEPPPPPPPPARDPINIQPLLGANINNVRHLLGTQTGTITGGLWDRGYSFDTNIQVQVQGSTIRAIIVLYPAGQNQTLFHFNGLNGYSNRTNVRNLLGTPDIAVDSPVAGDTYFNFNANRITSFTYGGPNGRISSITYQFSF